MLSDADLNRDIRRDERLGGRWVQTMRKGEVSASDTFDRLRASAALFLFLRICQVRWHTATGAI